MFGVEMLTNRLDGHLLIVAVGNAVFHAEIVDGVLLTFLDEQFQIALRMEGIQPAWRISQTIDDIGFEAVCVIYNRLHSVSLFKTFGIEFCLMFALDRRDTRSLGFDNSKRKSVAAKQHIVAIAFPLVVGHSFHLNLYARFRGLNSAFDVQHFPSCFFQHQVDV